MGVAGVSEVEATRHGVEMNTAALADAGVRRGLAMRCPAFFDSYYAGMRYAPHRERWLNEVVGAYVEARQYRNTPAIDAADTKVKMLLLAPRGHGKSELAVSLTSLLICSNRDIKVLFVGEAKDRAVDRLTRVKAILLSQRVYMDWTKAPNQGFGAFLPPRRDPRRDLVVWDKTKIRVLRDSSGIDPTVTAAGIDGAVTGGHYDVVIVDDPQTYKHVASPTQRAQHRLWLRSTVLPALDPGGLLLLIMTRKHHDDLASTVLKDPTWRVVTDQAIQDTDEVGDWADRVRDCVPVYDEDELGRQRIVRWVIPADAPDVLWRERPLATLLTERESMDRGGRANYAREYQNQVTDDKHVWFRRSLLEAAQRPNVDLYHGPWPLPQRDAGTGRSLIDYVRNGWCIGVAMERNNAGGFLAIVTGEDSDIPIVAPWTGREVNDPYQGVPSMSALLETGRVCLPYRGPESRSSVDALIDEFHGLGAAPHDDIVLATWIAERYVRAKLEQWDQQLELLARYRKAEVDRPAWLGSGDEPPAGLLVVQGWDPSFVVSEKDAEASDRDYTVGVTWGVDVRTRERWLLGIHRERGASHREKKLAVIREWKRFAPPAV